MPATAVRTITIIHFALIIGQVLFAGLAFSKKSVHYFSINYTGDTILYIAPLMAIVCTIVSVVLFNKRLAAAKKAENLSAKLGMYQAALISRSALLEGASLFNIAVFLITGNLLFISVAGIIILYFLYLRPGKDKIIVELELSYEEGMEL